MSKPANRIAAVDATASAADDERYALLQQIGDLIARAKTLKLSESVFLLKMVQLDLQTKIHAINDEELAAFMSALLSSLELH